MKLTIKKMAWLKKISQLPSPLFTKIKPSTKTISTKPITTRLALKEVWIVAAILQILLEVLSYRSIVDGFMTPIMNPLMFICGSFLIASTLSLALFLPKRHVGYMVFGFVWVFLGAMNFILLSFRTTPLTATDFKLLTSVFTVVSKYLNGIQMVFFAIGVSLVVAALVFIATRLPWTKIRLRPALITVALSFVLYFASFNTALTAGAVSRNFGNIAFAFKDYGFAYSFVTSVIDKGIKEPKTYSEEKVGQVLEAMAAESPKASDDTLELSQSFQASLDQLALDTANKLAGANTVPNIIIVQLESLFDAKRIKALEFNTDPIPNLTYLRSHYTSGYVTVPSIGAGTVNTEFEILSGMSLDYFGAGEYPYKTILKERTVESMPFVLTDLGYSTHAIHNNMGTFYSRQSVYPRLGFDTFTSIEYMNHVAYNEMDWAKDMILVPEIMKSLEGTTNQDFVFAVSVQPHGKYPSNQILEDPVIKIRMVGDAPIMINNDLDSMEDTILAENGVRRDPPALEGLDDSFDDPDEAKAQDGLSEIPKLAETTMNKYAYYVNQIYETDAFVGNLIRTLSDYKEPVVVLFYGDHMPTLDITEDDLRDGSPFQIEYVLWDNMGLEKKDEDLMAYQINSMIMERLGITEGLFNRFHQTMKDSATYEEELELLQYDVLYGDMNAYQGLNPYNRKKMTMGVDEILITDVANRGETLTLRGQNFTPYSEVLIDNEQVETLFVDNNTLIVPHIKLAEGMKIKVSQITETNWTLSSTKAYSVTAYDLPLE